MASHPEHPGARGAGPRSRAGKPPLAARDGAHPTAARAALALRASEARGCTHEHRTAARAYDASLRPRAQQRRAASPRRVRGDRPRERRLRARPRRLGRCRCVRRAANARAGAAAYRTATDLRDAIADGRSLRRPARPADHASGVCEGEPDPGAERGCDAAARGAPQWRPALVLAHSGSGARPLATQPVGTKVPATVAIPTAIEAPRVDVPPPPASGEPAPVASAEPTTKKAGGVAAKGATAKPAEERKGLDLGGLVPGAGGPNVGPGGASGGSAGGGLDQGGVERVVASHRAGVKRTCWERGGADQKSSVNVTISANVAPNGSVASTSSSGDDPVVAKCIENQVKSWMFPAPGANTTINIPFKFVRQ